MNEVHAIKMERGTKKIKEEEDRKSKGQTHEREERARTPAYHKAYTKMGNTHETKIPRSCV